MPKTISHMHHSFTEDLTEAIFVPGVVTSAIIKAISLFNIAQVNEWLQFGVLSVTLVAGIMKIAYMPKHKKEKKGEKNG